MTEDGRTFVSRWSRRKIAARQAEAQARQAPVAEPSPPAAPVADPAGESRAQPALPDVETLEGLRSEYRDFLRPEVDESLRSSALKRLFSDPHFNVMDGLDVYIDDYSRPDPIPHALLRSLNHARGLRLFDDEQAHEETRDETHVASQQEDQSSEAPASAPAVATADVNVTVCPPATEGPGACPVAVQGEQKSG
jgi:hypothetical protein